MTFRRILKGALIVCASMAMPVGAHAKDDGARALERLAACTADHPKWRIKVEEFLVLSHFDPAYFPLMKELALNEECDKHFNGMIHFSPSALATSVTPNEGLAAVISARLAAEKNMYADKPRFGAFGSFFARLALGDFFDFFAPSSLSLSESLSVGSPPSDSLPAAKSSSSSLSSSPRRA